MRHYNSYEFPLRHSDSIISQQIKWQSQRICDCKKRIAVNALHCTFLKRSSSGFKVWDHSLFIATLATNVTHITPWLSRRLVTSNCLKHAIPHVYPGISASFAFRVQCCMYLWHFQTIANLDSSVGTSIPSLTHRQQYITISFSLCQYYGIIFCIFSNKSDRFGNVNFQPQGKHMTLLIQLHTLKCQLIHLLQS